MESLTANMRKTFASLASTKGRRETGWFMAQGTKCVLDTLPHFDLVELLSTSPWAEGHPALSPLVVKAADIERISSLSTAPQVIAVYRIPEVQFHRPSAEHLALALDCVQDPGNLGTIMRVADWMGVTNIYASTDTADVWSPKVVQSTMGAISRVRVHYVDLPRLLADAADIPVYGTFLDGENIYQAQLTKGGIVVMGNEGRGISEHVSRCVNRKIHIPSYPPGQPTSESLNVAIATAITLSEFRRNG